VEWTTEVKSFSTGRDIARALTRITQHLSIMPIVELEKKSHSVDPLPALSLTPPSLPLL
jgi:hypothetical protein